MADLVIDNVAKEYPTRGDPLVVLRGVSLKLSAGENVAIVGPSGSGKSTLLHIVGTLESPTSGNVSLSGTDPFSLSEKELARFRNQNIGFIFQDHHLLPQLSVLENVLVPAIANSAASRETVQRANDLLDRVGMDRRKDHRPAELSGGERERVAVARALIRQPRLVLADEPTGNLDQANSQAVAELLLRLQAQENTMLIAVTHSTAFAGALQRRLELDNGRFELAQ